MLHIAMIRRIKAVCATTNEMLVNTATIDLDRAGIRTPARPFPLFSVSRSSDTSDPKKSESPQFKQFPTGPCWHSQRIASPSVSFPMQ